MSFALGSHRFNPQTGLWELVSPEAWSDFATSAPEPEAAPTAAVNGPVAPATSLEAQLPPPSDDIGIAPPVVPATPAPTVSLPPSEPVSSPGWWEPVPEGLIPPAPDALVGQVVTSWRNIRTGETFLAPTGGWTSENPDWTDGFQRMPSDPILESQQGVTAAIAPPQEPEGQDVFVAPETLIVCAPVVPELVEVEEPVDIVIGPWVGVPPIPPTIIETADGLIIIGGPIHSVLEGGDGNDLIIAGASADHPGNWYPIGWCGSPPYYLQGDRLSGGLGQDTLIGNDLGNRLEGGAGADVMIGGGGNDVYVVNDAGDRVIEYDHGGYDRVVSAVSYILSDNVENLTLASGAGDINGAGNNLDNLLWGNEGRNILSGGAGNDVLVGGSGDTFIGGQGQDLFVCGSGDSSLVIADFQVGVDRIIGLPYEYNDQTGEYFVVPAMRQDGADTVITTWGQGEIRLIGVDMRLLSAQDFVAGDFLFANPDFWCCG